MWQTIGLIVFFSLFFIGITFLFIFNYKIGNKAKEMLDETTSIFIEKKPNLKTIEDCDELLNLIENRFNNTDSSYREMRIDYMRMYFFVKGMRYQIKKTSDSIPHEV